MFEANSRYYPLETASLTASDGRVIAYKRRRFLPRGEDLSLLSEVTVQDSDRLDLISARTIGDPEQFWRIADANNALNPFDLVTQPGDTIRVPVPQVEEPR